MNLQALIDSYESGGTRLRNAVAGLSREQLTAFPIPSTWSIHQIVIHLMHAETYASLRITQAIAEEVPLVMDWNENAFIERLPSHVIPLDLAQTAFDATRRVTASILRTLQADDWERVAVHSKRGRMTVLQMLESYDRHLTHHLSFVDRKRKLVGG
jgi:uncharacterized damage-inducible protein DinB